MKKALPLTLVLIGGALLITAVVFWIDSSTSTEPQSFGKTLLDWVTLIVGLGASIKGWMDLFKPDKPTPPAMKIEVKGGNPQVSTGDHARNIQSDTYIENQNIQQPPEPKTPKSLNQLPTPPLDFVGREKELAELRKNIEGGVLISSVQGMGGIGKTALGLKLAEQIAPNYPDGQIYIDLRGAHEQTPLTPEQVMAHVIKGFHPEAALPLDFSELGAMYRSVLSNKKVLLFYDNARDEDQLHFLLPPKDCLLLITSRQLFILPGLNAINLEILNPKDARNIVQKIVPQINKKDAVTIARQCGYLPLAIRTAAGILLLHQDWSPSRLIERLEDNKVRLGLVNSSLQLSYDLLDSKLQAYLHDLSIFSGSIDRTAISAIWDCDMLLSKEKIDDMIGNLLRTNLLLYDPKRSKYNFHDLTHLFLEEKLLTDENLDKILVAYAQFALHTLEKFILSTRGGLVFRTLFTTPGSYFAQRGSFIELIEFLERNFDELIVNSYSLLYDAVAFNSKLETKELQQLSSWKKLVALSKSDFMDVGFDISHYLSKIYTISRNMQAPFPASYFSNIRMVGVLGMRFIDRYSEYVTGN